MDDTSVAQAFLASGHEHWAEKLSSVTFCSQTLSLSRLAADEIVTFFTTHVQHEIAHLTSRRAIAALDARVRAHIASSHVLSNLCAKIERAAEALAADAYFVKLSTRSPKDSPLVRGAVYEEVDVPDPMELGQALRFVSAAMQHAQRCHDGVDAVALLATSERVWEDLELAQQHGEDLAIVVKPFAVIPPHLEFRAFVWDGRVVAMSQYNFLLHDAVLIKQAQTHSSPLFDRLIALARQVVELCPPGNETHSYILDLAIADDVAVLVEINPFDNVNGTMEASTALFSWENPEHRSILTGKREGIAIRVVQAPPSKFDVMRQVNAGYRGLLARALRGK